jgi:hypothetical protein
MNSFKELLTYAEIHAAIADDWHAFDKAIQSRIFEVLKMEPEDQTKICELGKLLARRFAGRRWFPGELLNRVYPTALEVMDGN